MIYLALGLATLGALLWSAQAFSRAKVSSLKALGAWVAALAGLSLMTMLLLTGRGAQALAGALLLGPLVWNGWQQAHARSRERTRAPRMSRAEALEVLGLKDPVSDSDVRAAWVRLMRVAHPDSGGTDWLAARLNQAKDVLLRRR